MFKPNVPCLITRMDGPVSLYGQITEGSSTDSKCGIIRLEVGTLKTSVRADSSASRGNAKEIVAQSRLLFSPDDLLEHGDKVTVHGFDLRVESVYPRYNVNGLLDHWQVDLTKWASE